MYSSATLEDALGVSGPVGPEARVVGAQGHGFVAEEVAGGVELPPVGQALAGFVLPAQAAQQRHLDAPRAQRVGGFVEDRAHALERLVQVAGSGVEARELEARGGAIRPEDLRAVPLRAGLRVVAGGRVGEAQVVLHLGVVGDAGLRGGEQRDRVLGTLQGHGETARGLQEPEAVGKSLQPQAIGLGGGQQVAVALLGVAEHPRSRRRCAGRAEAPRAASAGPAGSPTP